MNSFAFALSAIASLFASALVYPFSAIVLFPVLSLITFVFGQPEDGNHATEMSNGIYTWTLIAIGFGLSAVSLLVWQNIPEAEAVRFVDGLLGASASIDKAAYLTEIQGLVQPQSAHRYIGLSTTLMALPFVMIAASAPWFLALFGSGSRRAQVPPVTKLGAALLLTCILGLLVFWSLYVQAIGPTDGNHPMMDMTYAFRHEFGIFIILRSGLLALVSVFIVLFGALVLDSARQAIGNAHR